jgi:formylglycine-generating enzyme required for sulfatase activity
VAELVCQVAEAAHALHEKGIIHRDVKPDNIMVGPDGAAAVLMDLGLAQIADEVQGRLTRTRQFVGTLRYASPEQVLAAARLDRRSDVYSLGATLWELLTLRPLFGATEETPTPELMQKIQIEEPTRVRSYNPAVPRDLAAVVDKCLQKDPRKRYPTAQELAGELESFLAGRPVKARPVTGAERLWKWARRRPAPAALIVLATVALAGVVASALTIAWQGKEVAAKTEQYLNGLLSVSERDLDAGRFDVAIRGLTTVLDLRPGDARASQLLLRARVGQLLATARANDSPDNAAVALQALTQLLELDPDHAEARALKRKITGYEYLLDSTGLSGFSAAQVRSRQEAWARRLGRAVEETVEIADGVKMTFVLVPPGKFHMGSPLDEEDRSSDEKLHEVTLMEPFYLGKTEVTQVQYEALMGNNPSQLKGADRPVEQVSWEDARACAEKLTKKRDDKHLYRLPTEAEWEYSCRGGRPSSQPFGIGDGRALSSREANFNGDFPYGGADKGPNLKSTCRVGSYSANALGLYDMHGNVWEWCADWYGRYPSGAVTNPAGPTEGSDRVIRGGGWDYYARDCRAAGRGRFTPMLRNYFIGFRLARSLPSGSK